MNIPRHAIVHDIFEFCRADNALIIGDPGIGKSWTMRALEQFAHGQQIPVELVAIDSIYAEDERELNAYLGLTTDLVDYFRQRNTSPGTKGLLLFDAFDAARSDKKRNLFLRLIRRCITALSGAWTIAVSVRTFDAQKSHELIRLFPDRSSPTPRARVATIPLLSAAEIALATSANDRLAALFRHCSVELQQLLRIPFNLWLLEQIAVSTTEVDMSGLYTATELLDLFWSCRVHREGSRDQNEAVLRRVAEQQVASKQFVSIRSDVFDPILEQAWHQMFSANLLDEDQRTKNGVKFTHNILFDFAVARLLIPDEPHELASFLSEDPARPLFLRPSLVYHFEDQFHRRPENFWRNLSSACVSQDAAMTPVTRVILPTVLVTEARELGDFQRLVRALASREQFAVAAISYVLQAVRAVDLIKPENERKYALWSDLLVSISDYFHINFAWDAGWINGQASDYARKNSISAIQDACATVATKLFDWGWIREGQTFSDWNYRYVSVWAIPQISQLFRVHRQKSRELFAHVLELLEKPGFPIDCIHALCSNIRPIIDADPVFAADVVRRVFGHSEKSEEQTAMGGIVLPMFSNRRQDYELCHHNLIEAFPYFLRRDSVLAIAAGVDALAGLILLDHVVPYLKPDVSIPDLESSFSFRGQTVRYIPDFSHVWDRRAYADQELRIADAIEDHFKAQADRNDVRALTRELDSYVEHAVPAIFWKRLLELGSEHPKTFASLLQELAIAQPIMTGFDTVYALGIFLSAAFPYWSNEQKIATEENILQLPTLKGSKLSGESLTDFRDRLVSCIPVESLQTSALKEVRKKLARSERPVRNKPLTTFETEWRPYTMEQFLEEQGSAVEQPLNAALLGAAKALEPVKATSEPRLSEEQIAQFIELIESADALLARSMDADEKVKTHLLTELGSAADRLVRFYREFNERQLDLLRNVLLRAARDPNPRADEERDAEWKHASWSPWPRNEAAQGLGWLALARPHDEDVLRAIEELSRDPVPSVRFLIATELFRLGRDNVDAMYRILEDRTLHERNSIVLHGLCVTLFYLLRLPRCREFVKRLYEQIQNESVGAEYHADVVAMIVDISISQTEVWAVQAVESWISNVDTAVRFATEASNRLIHYVTPTVESLLFRRALSFEQRLIRSSLNKMLELQGLAKRHDIPETERKLARTLYRILDHAIANFYFAFDFEGTGRSRGDNVPTDGQRRAFFSELTPLLDSIIEFGNHENGSLLAPTAHHLMQLLRAAVDYNPNEVLRLAAQLAVGSTKGNYQFDSLAIKEVVELVEDILADHRGEMRDAHSFKNLLTLLDIFASAGWPEALGLVWRLDEVYR